MTDRDVINTFVHCFTSKGSCSGCPREREEYCDDDMLVEFMVEIYNRQNGEIERLQGDLIEERTRRENAVNAYHEAIKKFAENVKEEISDGIRSNFIALHERENHGIVYDSFSEYCRGKIHALEGIADFIDNYVKEKVGERE